MTLHELIDKLDLEVITGGDFLDRQPSSGYCSDLLSFVMANSAKDSIWVTLQSHPNIVAVSSLIGHAAIIVTEGVEVDEETCNKALREETVILRTSRSNYATVGELYELGIKADEDE